MARFQPRPGLRVGSGEAPAFQAEDGTTGRRNRAIPDSRRTVPHAKDDEIALHCRGGGRRDSDLRKDKPPPCDRRDNGQEEQQRDKISGPHDAI